MLLWSVWSVWCDGEVISRVTSARDAQARVHSKVNVENPAQRRPLPAYLLRVFKLPITLDVTNKRPFFLASGRAGPCPAMDLYGPLDKTR